MSSFSPPYCCAFIPTCLTLLVRKPESLLWLLTFQIFHKLLVSHITFLHTSCNSEIFLQEGVEGEVVACFLPQCSPGPSLSTSSRGQSCSEPGAVGMGGRCPEKISQLLPAVLEKYETEKSFTHPLRLLRAEEDCATHSTTCFFEKKCGRISLRLFFWKHFN